MVDLFKKQGDIKNERKSYCVCFNAFSFFSKSLLNWLSDFNTTWSKWFSWDTCRYVCTISNLVYYYHGYYAFYRSFTCMETKKQIKKNEKLVMD